MSLNTSDRAVFLKLVAVLVFVWTTACLWRWRIHHALETGDASPPPPPEEAALPPPRDAAERNVGYFAAANASMYTDRVAVMLENRPLPHILPIFLHFSAVLGPRWPMMLYTSAEAGGRLRAASPLWQRVLDGRRVQFRDLPANATAFANHAAISVFLADRWLWEDLAPYDKVLLFQVDSMVCAGGAHTIDDFLAFDMIGAPVPADKGRGWNGGLSLRSRARLLDVLDRWDFARDSRAADAPTHHRFEDQWFSARMLDLPPRADGTPAARLPSTDEALRFAVEFIWADRPFGFHQPDRANADRMADILEYCPEVGMMRKSQNY